MDELVFELFKIVFDYAVSKLYIFVANVPEADYTIKLIYCRVLMARYVLAGPQPCELVDVKVDLTYKYNTLTRSGSFFRATQSLKLVRILQRSSCFTHLILFLEYPQLPLIQNCLLFSTQR